MSDIYSAIVTDCETELISILLYEHGQYHKPLAVLDEDDVSRLISGYIEFAANTDRQKDLVVGIVALADVLYSAEGSLVLRNKTMVWNETGKMWRIVNTETGDTVYQGRNLKQAISYILDEVTA